MPQRLKTDVRDRIVAAAAQAFATHGYAGTSIATVARDAGLSPGNIYRYFPNKAALLEAVVDSDLVARFDALLDARLASLAGLADLRRLDAGAQADQAAMLDFWIAHRWAVVILLDRGADTPWADFGARFVDRLVGALFAARPLPESARFVGRQIFEGTRRAIVAILLEHADRVAVQAAFAHFWRYQLAGLAGFTEGMQ